MQEIVKKVLEDYPETRANDDKLRVIVLEKMGVDTGKSFCFGIEWRVERH